MKSYVIRRFAGSDFSWDRVNTAEIDSWVWGRQYTPRAQAQAAAVDGEELRFRLTCFESSPKAVYKNFFDDVYKDSCLEAFFTYFDVCGTGCGGHVNGYVNCEMNSAGASLVAYGPDRFSRTRIDRLAARPSVTASVSSDRWTVEAVFRLSELKKIFGEDASLDAGTKLRGNFYKCGDETAIPHFGSWNPIGTPSPDFHCPQYFGEWTVED